MKKTLDPRSFVKGGNAIPTRKLAPQLIASATEEAVGLADWLKSSDTRNQGMLPGPVAKRMMKMTTSATDIIEAAA